MIHIAGSIRVNDVEGAKAAIEELTTASRAEAGCVEYSLSFDLLEANLVWINERWESMEALGAHAQSAHYNAWSAKAGELGISDSDVRLYTEEPTKL